MLKTSQDPQVRSAIIEGLGKARDPDSVPQFLDAMGSFNMAMGKNCEFCHVQGKMDVDEKKEKKTARKMMEMTHDINAQNFEGKNEVRCYTCHKGLPHPAGRPEFPE